MISILSARVYFIGEARIVFLHLVALVAALPIDYKTAVDFLSSLSCEKQVIGTSLEGREISMFIPGKKSGPRILVTSMIHANERIGFAVTGNFLKRMCSKDVPVNLPDVQYFVVPIVNPDGFAAAEPTRKN